MIQSAMKVLNKVRYETLEYFRTSKRQNVSKVIAELNHN